MTRRILIGLLVCCCSVRLGAQAPAAPPTSVPPTAPAPTTAAAAPWFEMQALTVAARYRYIDTSAGVETANHLQHNGQMRFRVKLDPGGHLGVVAGIATGNTFIGGWENLGVGTPGDRLTEYYLKQFYVNLVPETGVEVQAGGLYVVRGESTEITSYDNDGYLMGERLSLKRPRDLYFDEISVTRGYLGDTAQPSWFRRNNRLGEWNYFHVLVDKKFSSRLAVSADLTGVAGVRTGRAAALIKVPDAVVLDAVRVEGYRRFDGAAGGYAVTVERTPRTGLTIGGGLANVDLNYGGLNADRFGKGQRWFVNGSLALVPDLSLLVFYQHAFNNDVALANRQRLDVIVQMNVLKALQRHGIF